MPRSGFKLNHGGVESLLKSSSTRALLLSRAELVLAAARSSAPVATGAYRDSLHLVHDTTDRAVVRVVAGDRKAPIIEANFGVLGRALDAAR